ncbi:glycoside hydrolase family 6 protein [Nocardioides lijunqiniae]|uniref:glycoside hydrolase family 6 protein n=1 Tax=Nocardioides lijunqiniae TaxID=2760832 RepID=UPI00187776B8
MISERAWVPVVLGLLLLSGCAGADGDDPEDPAGGSGATLAPVEGNPFVGHGLYVDPASRAGTAAEQARTAGDEDSARAFQRLAETPAGIWLTPEALPPGQVGPAVAATVSDAASRNEVPTFVVYGIPDRDCTGGFSGGGLPAEEYGPWVQEIADNATGSAVVIEPDALASALECDNLEERVGLISDAVSRLAAAGTATYLDGGHSDWVSPDSLAPVLQRAGVDQARGFATNVSNYQEDDAERSYAEQLSGLLGGTHYVIDSGRNGRGSTQEWCNPPGRAYGRAPEAVDDGTGLDAFLWVKPPGESDGECQGGPAAGEFWPQHALEMATASGW